MHYITQYLNQKYGCDVQVTECIEPSLICSNQKEFVAMCSAYERVIGKKPNVSIAKGIGYNAALPNCAIFGPRFDIEHDDEPDTCHMADECRSIGNFLKFYEVLKIFLKEVL